MKKETIKKLTLFLTLVVLLSASLITFRSSLKDLWYKYIQKPKQEEYMTVFVHGAFGSLLGFFSFFQVLNDEVEGTRYKKTISKMRKDPYFYKSQPILQRGLVKIEPTFNFKDIQNNKYVAYPIAKAYQTILEQIKPHQEKNYFYTFGWSGLLSQKRRRQESIRFYNALSEEFENLKKQGINPKIRILAHSHGGNLSLNLAGINTVLNNLNTTQNIEKISQNEDEKGSLLNLLQIIKNLPTKNVAKTKSGQKAFEYIPTNKNLTIDELIMLGTPIQPETEPFAFNNFFNKVFNFYSEEDFAQKADWVSSRRYYSDQRLSKTTSKVIQAKIMVGRGLEKILTTTADKTITTTLIANSQNKKSFWSKLFSGENPWKTKTQDPSHKELWFTSWEKEEDLTPFDPIPTVVFTPLFLSAIEKISDKINDIDLNLNIAKRKVTLSVIKHGKIKIENKVSIYRNIIDKIKKKISKWKPDDLSHSAEHNIISKYS